MISGFCIQCDTWDDDLDEDEHCERCAAHDWEAPRQIPPADAGRFVPLDALIKEFGDGYLFWDVRAAWRY